MRTGGFGLTKSDRRQNWFTAEIFVKGQKVTGMSRLACISTEESRKSKGFKTLKTKIGAGGNVQQTMTCQKPMDLNELVNKTGDINQSDSERVEGKGQRQKV